MPGAAEEPRIRDVDEQRVAEQIEARLADKPICCCRCHEGGSILEALTARCRSLVARLPPLSVSEDLASRLSDSVQYQFGFDDFIPSADGSRIVARFYCAVKDRLFPSRWRFFKIDVPRLGAVSAPSEYNKGDRFFIDDNVTDAFDLQHMIKLPDRVLADHLEATRSRLHAFVEEQAR